MSNVNIHIYNFSPEILSFGGKKRALLQVSCCGWSVAKSYLTLRDLMDCSTPGFPVLHYLPEFAQIVSMMPSNHLILCHPLLLLLSIFPSFTVLLLSQLFASGGQPIGASTSILPMNIQDWFPLGLTGLISLLSKGLPKVFSNTTVQKHQFFSAQHSLWPTLVLVHDHWENHSFDCKHLCRQSDVSAF